MKKKRIFILAVMLICLALAATGTLAYFNADDQVHNVITSGNIAIDLIEQKQLEDGSLVPYTNPVDVMPGTDVSKIVTVQNTGVGDAWIRVSVDSTVTFQTPTDAAPQDGDVVLNFDTENWVLKDDYYYYTKPVAANGVTAPLFTTVSFSPKMGNIYQGSKLDIVIQAQGVQAANNGSTVLEAAGWPSSNS